jgi:hypothetical protein
MDRFLVCLSLLLLFAASIGAQAEHPAPLRNTHHVSLQSEELSKPNTLDQSRVTVSGRARLHETIPIKSATISQTYYEPGKTHNDDAFNDSPQPEPQFLEPPCRNCTITSMRLSLAYAEKSTYEFPKRDIG